MAKPNHENTQPPADEKQPPPETTAAAWGTWEELLLAYAVNRYGTNSWDSIASELRKRTSDSNAFFTPKQCKQKYLDLERRFDDSTTATAAATAAPPWIEELRKLRVEELERKLQKFDIYISSLQLKVKKLTEENGYGEMTKSPDLGRKTDDVEMKTAGEVKSSDGESEKDDRSVNGSNGNLETTTGEKPENEPDSGEIGGPDGNEPVKSEPDDDGVEPESKSKENYSDVQSSASKSRKERSDRVRRGCTKVDGHEDEHEDQPSDDGIPVRSLPLIDFLKKVHQLGSAVFERRLDRQEKMRYKKLIREHIDYEILQTRLKQGRYSDGNNKFFRDLLLLVNNTFVFFSNESPQSVAAIQLRQFILNEMMTSNTKQKPDPKSKPTSPPLKQSPDPRDSMPPKPQMAGSMIVCRKRSSIAAKSSGRKETRIGDGFPPISKKPGKNNNVLESHSSGSENSDVKSDVKEVENKKPVVMEEKRMNRSSSAAASTVAAGGGSEDGCGGGGQKRGGEGKKEEVVKRSSGGRQSDSPAKRSVGRPPKKGAAPPPAVAAMGKRNRGSAESEPLVTKQAKKRSKRFY